MNFIAKYIKQTACILFVIAVSVICFFRYTSDIPKEATVFAFDTYMKFEIYGRNAKSAVKAGEKLIYDTEKELSVYKEESIVYKYNHAKPGEKIKCSENVQKLIEKSLYINKLTDGAFDITIYPLCELWDVKNASVPPSGNDIKNALEKVGSGEIEIKDGYLIKHENTMLDFGGIAKGYLSDELRALMSDYGIKKGLINLGGNVVTIGKKGKNKPWNIGIADPNNPNEAITSISASDTNVITSGAYQRYFEYNGKIYHHIISPYTGYPSESGLSSVTVSGKGGALCDGMSTAAFILGREKGEKLIKDLNLSAVFVTTDGEIVRVNQ